MFISISIKKYNNFVNYILPKINKEILINILEKLNNNEELDLDKILNDINLKDVDISKLTNKSFTPSNKTTYNFLKYLANLYEKNKDNFYIRDIEMIEVMFNKTQTNDITEDEYINFCNNIRDCKDLAKRINDLNSNSKIYVFLRENFLNIG